MTLADTIRSLRSAAQGLARSMRRAAGSLLDLFLPPSCAACAGPLPEGSRGLCPRCRIDMPLTGYSEQFDNPVAQKFWGLVPIVGAASYIFFVRDGGYRRAIHNFKYRGDWRLARTLGEHFGAELARSPLFSSADIIVPVPLHWRKRLARGYNQSEYIALGMGKAMGLRVECRSLVRRRHNASQARTHRHDRWHNVEGIFAVRNPDALRGRHIILVDDVLTTGATITSCAEAIIAAVPDCRLSIATIAVSPHELGIKM